MTIRKTLSRILVTALCATGFCSAALAQTVSRVDAYIATPFLAGWTDISATGDAFAYTNRSGYGTVVMPFDFPYDDSLISAGSEIRVGASGAISLLPDTMPHTIALDSEMYPGLVCLFSSSLVTGSGRTADSDYDEVEGAAPNRVLTIQYHASHMPGSGGGLSGNAIMMQVKFYESSGNIEFIYQDHNRVLDSSHVPALMGAVGLNGFLTPRFVANIYGSNLTATPATDIRWTPASSFVAQASTYDGFSLGACYPNPFSGKSQVEMTLPESGRVQLVIVDLTGKVVQTVLDKRMGAGTFQVTLDASSLASGTYYYQLTAGTVTLTRQMMVVK